MVISICDRTAERVGVDLSGVSLVAPVERSRPAWLLDDGDRVEAG